MIWLKNLFRRRGSFTLVIQEPLGGPAQTKQIPIEHGKTLFEYLGERWRAGSYARARGKPLGFDWARYRPAPGETIELCPPVGARSFTEAYIDRLNAKTGGGQFIKTAILTVTTVPLVKRYFADHDRDVTFAGNSYERLPMAWSDYDVQRRMPFPTVTVTVPNMGNEVIGYIETNPLLDHDIVLELIHLDLLGDSTAKDSKKLVITAIAANDIAANFICGLNLGLQDRFPRERILRSEFPAIPETMAKF